MFYDHMMLMTVGNYIMKATLLQRVESLSVGEYGRVFHGNNNNPFSSTMRTLNTKKNVSKGVKRETGEYGSRSGMSLVKIYGRGKVKRKFVIRHCKDAFRNKNKCVFVVCGECKIIHNKNGNKCPICKDSIVD